MNGYQMQLLERRVERLETLLDVLVRRKRSPFELELGEESGDDDLPFEKWLAEWQAEEPGSFLSREELLDEIACYERKYGMSSDELLRRIRAGTAPDSSDIMDWKILLEWL